MKHAIYLILIFFSFSSFAQTYVAGSVSSLTQIDTSEDGDPNADLLMEGSGFSAYLGHRFSFIAVEAFYKNYETSSEKDTLEFTMNNTAIGLGIRFFILKFLNIRLGSLKHDAKGELKNGSTVILDYESTSSGSYFGAGLRFPIGSLDIFGDYTIHATKDDNSSDAGVAYSDIELGLRYFF